MFSCAGIRRGLKSCKVRKDFPTKRDQQVVGSPTIAPTIGVVDEVPLPAFEFKTEAALLDAQAPVSSSELLDKADEASEESYYLKDAQHVADATLDPLDLAFEKRWSDTENLASKWKARRGEEEGSSEVESQGEQAGNTLDPLDLAFEKRWSDTEKLASKWKARRGEEGSSEVDEKVEGKEGGKQAALEEALKEVVLEVVVTALEDAVQAAWKAAMDDTAHAAPLDSETEGLGGIKQSRQPGMLDPLDPLDLKFEKRWTDTEKMGSRWQAKAHDRDHQHMSRRQAHPIPQPKAPFPPPRSP